MSENKEGKKEVSSNWESHVQPHGEIREIVSGCIWEVQGIFGGNPSNKRNMTIYKLADKTLLCISVIALKETEMKKLLEIGQPSIILVPNMQHTIDTKVWADRFPEAKVICPAIFKASLEQKKRVTVAATTEDFLPKIGVNFYNPDGVKSQAFDVGGEQVYELKIGEEEVALLFTDLVMNGEGKTWLKKFLFSGGFDTPRIIKWFILKDTSKFKTFMKKIAENPKIKIVCVAHGPSITENAREKLIALIERI